MCLKKFILTVSEAWNEVQERILGILQHELLKY